MTTATSTSAALVLPSQSRSGTSNRAAAQGATRPTPLQSQVARVERLVSSFTPTVLRLRVPGEDPLHGSFTGRGHLFVPCTRPAAASETFPVRLPPVHGSAVSRPHLMPRLRATAEKPPVE